MQDVSIVPDRCLGTLLHRVQEDGGEESGHADANLWTDKLVSDHLAEHLSTLLPVGGYLGVAKHVQDVDHGALGEKKYEAICEI